MRQNHGARPVQLPLLDDFDESDEAATMPPSPPPSTMASRAPVMPGVTLAATLRRQGIVSETHLARLACELGAEQCGGALTDAERALVVAARQEQPVEAAFVAAVRRAIRDGDDPLGALLCTFRPAPVRRQHGAFYTPPAIVAAMVTWLLAHPLARVVDPGCGSGRFAAAVARQQPDVPIIAVDTDPLATLLTRAALAVLGARNAQVVQHDYLTLRLPSCAGPTGFLANPPYVRHHDLSTDAKAWAVTAGKRLTIAVSGLSGLHTLFYLATALNARHGDVGCFITSAEWLDTRYGQAIRQLLIGRLGLRGLAVLHPHAMPFADAMTTAAITAFTAGVTSEYIALNLVDTIGFLDLNIADDTVERRELAQSSRWSPFLRRRDAPLHDRSSVPLRTIARVHRGVATGRNEYFVLTRERAESLQLLPWCRPAITGAEEILRADGVVHDGPERRLLLVVPSNIDRGVHPALDAYLCLGEQARNDKPPIAHGYLASHRTPWWYLGPVSTPPIIASYMARQAPAFAYNPDGLVFLNVAHGIYPHQPLSAAQIQDLVRQLNAARTTFTGHGRTYQGGLEKFEPREMENLPIHLNDGRLLLIECKVSNTGTNSVKRLNRECGGKAARWRDAFGQSAVCAAVLAGVFRQANLRDAQDSDKLTLLWEHNLTPLEAFLSQAWSATS